MIIVGDGGHAKVVKRVIYAMRFQADDRYAFVAIGNNSSRKGEVILSKASGYKFPVLIHPRAVVDETATIGEGTIVMAGAVVQADAVIGRHCILNTSCSIDHDCVLGDFVHIAPGAHLCGGVHVGEGALVGVGARAIPLARIREWALVKAGETAK